MPNLIHFQGEIVIFFLKKEALRSESVNKVIKICTISKKNKYIHKFKMHRLEWIFYIKSNEINQVNLLNIGTLCMLDVYTTQHTLIE